VRFSAEENKPICGLSDEANGLIQNFDWPGNVRQLENTIFRAVVLCDADILDVCDFPQIAGAAGIDVRPRSITALPDAIALEHTNGGFEIPPTQNLLSINAMSGSGQMRRLDDIEAQVIRMAIDHYDGRMSEVARRLGIGRSTLYRKLKEFGLEPVDAEFPSEPAMQAAS
jgi:DNA-binding NtrC family response regulator